jgi:hypothetical protein
MEPKRWLGGSDPYATFQLPGVTFDVRVAVHPSKGVTFRTRFQVEIQ